MTAPAAEHRMALQQLEEIAEASGGALRIDTVRRSGDRLVLTLSLDCEDVPVDEERGGIELDPRESIVVRVPEDFPFAPPHAEVDPRFGTLPFVGWQRHLCLFHAEGDWNPADGMAGFVYRLADWFRRAAAGTLVETGQPLHPPTADYSMATGCVLVAEDLPTERQVSGAFLLRRYAGRVDLLEWCGDEPDGIGDPKATERRLMAIDKSVTDTASDDDDSPAAYFAMVHILRRPLGFAFPDTVSDLLDELTKQGADRKEFTRRLMATILVNQSAEAGASKPIYLMVGAPAAVVAGEAPRIHFAAWQLDVGSLIEKGLESRPIRWTPIYEHRPQAIVRRDSGRPSEWLRNKRVLILGCGAVGARLAEHCVRAGASGLIVADHGGVGPGVLTRQPYAEDDIGLPKAWVLADRLKDMVTGTNVDITKIVNDVISTVLRDTSLIDSVNLVIDATANHAVSQAIEHLRWRSGSPWPPILTAAVGHTCERAFGSLSFPHASGAGADILRSFADTALNTDELRDAAEDFFPEPGTRDLFLPEPGCSDPTFAGGDAEVAALSGHLLVWALGALADHSLRRPVDHKSAFLARLSGLPGVRLGWPDDPTADDQTSSYQIRIRPSALETIRSEAEMTDLFSGPFVETGGLLFGAIDHASRVVWVTSADPPSPDSDRRENYFRHGTEGVEARINHHLEISHGRARFLGWWHTHPGVIPFPSDTDTSAMDSLPASTPGQALLLIVGGRGPRWHQWLNGAGPPDLNARLCSRGEFTRPRGPIALSPKDGGR